MYSKPAAACRYSIEMSADEEARIIEQLRSHGCDVGSETSRLGDVPRELVLGVVRRCVQLAQHSSDGVSEQPQPQSKGEQVLVASRVAEACSSLGYRGPLGYDLFLYPNEADLKAVLAFLLAKIVPEDDRACAALRRELNRPWFPRYCLPAPPHVWTNSKRYVQPFLSKPFLFTRANMTHHHNITQAFFNYWSETVSVHHEPTVVVDGEAYAEEILTKLRSMTGRRSCASNIRSSDTDEKPQPPAASERLNVRNLSAADMSNVDRHNELLECIRSLREDDGDIGFLENLLCEEAERLRHEVQSKKDRFERIKETTMSQEDKRQEETLSRLEQRIQHKTLKLRKLQRKNVPFMVTRDGERSIYSNDVLDTIDQLHKLKVDVTKIISNINTTQKEINRINGVLDRSFVVADELIFKDAKKDEFARKTYKLIAGVHTECEEMCNMVREIGAFARDTVALEKSIETAERKNVKENLDRAVEDLHNLSATRR